MLRSRDLPENKDFFLYVIKHGKPAEKEYAAVTMAECESARKEAIRAVLEDPDERLYKAVLKKLECLDDQDAILSMAAGEPSEKRMKTDNSNMPRENNRQVLAVSCIKDRSVLEDFALHAEDAEVRAAALANLDKKQSRGVIRQYVLSEKNRDHLLEAVRKLSYPEDRDVLLEIAHLAPGTTGRETAIWQFPWPEEEAVIRKLAPTSLAAEKIMIRASLCPVCGEEIHRNTEYELLGDDLEDGSFDRNECSCSKCGWHTSWNEYVDKAWQDGDYLYQCPEDDQPDK